ncbi:MAG: Asp-tRNA(Asn)/Glu-tRNA(Gln) amidotransferase subunit GatC [Trueperaceae bacterium]|nr:Asp-tRNA(Asn)/Glu-tRNA(Gln) amidotransferase subunit GatC [Trueperaceae bacterium]
MISDKDMEHLKNLARLEIEGEETQHLKDDLNKILDYFEQIRHLDTEGIEELARPVSLHNIFREDKIGQSLAPEAVNALANETENNFFKVPRTVDSSE